MSLEPQSIKCRNQKTLSNLSKQITNKYMSGYQVVSGEIQTHTWHLYNTHKHKSATAVYISSGVQVALTYLALLGKNITLIIFELLYTAVLLIHSFLFIYIDNVRYFVLCEVQCSFRYVSMPNITVHIIPQKNYTLC